MIRIVAIVVLIAVIWEGIPSLVKRLRKAKRSRDVATPLDVRDDQKDD